MALNTSLSYQKILLNLMALDTSLSYQIYSHLNFMEKSHFIVSSPRNVAIVIGPTRDWGLVWLPMLPLFARGGVARRECDGLAVEGVGGLVEAPVGDSDGSAICQRVFSGSGSSVLSLLFPFLNIPLGFGALICSLPCFFFPPTRSMFPVV